MKAVRYLLICVAAFFGSWAVTYLGATWWAK